MADLVSRLAAGWAVGFRRPQGANLIRAIKTVGVARVDVIAPRVALRRARVVFGREIHLESLSHLGLVAQAIGAINPDVFCDDIASLVKCHILG